MDANLVGRPSTLRARLNVTAADLLFLAWISVLLFGPALLAEQYAKGHDYRYFDPIAHASLETFCGITALLIAGLLFVLARQYRELPLWLFGLAFAVMGALDLGHALTPPAMQLQRFVHLHTWSTIFGGTLIVLGAGAYVMTGGTVPERRRMLTQTVVLSAIVLAVGSAALLTEGWQRPPGEDFSLRALRSHELAAALYVVASVAGFVYYRVKRQLFALVVAALLLLFAESAYLFRFSFLWDLTWWTWHAVKAVFYLGILVAIAGGLVIALRAVERSRAAVSAAHAALEESHSAKEVINRELHIRNRMANEAINCLDLNCATRVIANALANFIDVEGYDLVLKVPADEVAELQRKLGRQRLDWRVQAVPQDRPLPRGMCDGGGFCLQLRANDREFGVLAPRLKRGCEASLPDDLLADLAAEIGPILYSALAEAERNEATHFRSGMLRVSAMLGSTLELSDVLERVCHESAELLDSDAAMVFLREGSPGFTIASRCILTQPIEVRESGRPAWADSPDGQRLLAELRRTRRPVALLHTGGGRPALRFADAACDWGAAAVFPLFVDETLKGLMVILRKTSVAFSNATLEQGILLADSVRVAVNNARSYQALREANRQLKAAEAGKLRAERLAVLGQMAATVAHEVRNPLGAIENCAAVLRGSVSGKRNALEALEIVEDEVQRLERLTRNFLNIGRSRRPVPPSIERVDLGQLVEAAVKRVRRHIAHEGLDVKLHVQVRGTDGPVRVESDGLHEVIWNLVLNATQVLGGTGVVLISVRVRPRHICLLVQDDGPGIPSEERVQIFEPFWSKRSQGAGLGLVVVREMVMTWSGRLRVLSRPGQGTCFAILIPRGERSEAASRQGATEEVVA